MRQQEKIKTSVFSEYENNQNDSLSSRQLQYWLKQTAPSVQPKFAGIEWTLMSTNSIFEQQQHTLQRNQTFQSLNKENDQLAFNSARPTLSNNSSAVLKSKSYLNAMVDLQNRVKNLQQENKSLQKSMDTLKGERNKLMSESSHQTQELKQRLQLLEPKAKKIEQLIRQNKILRDSRQQGTRKAKMLQKINKQNQSKLVQYEKLLQKLQEQMIERDQLHKQTINKMNGTAKEQEKMRESLLKLQERNKVLEDMKEKSTATIIEKYNKSVQMVETLTAHNIQLKQELQGFRDRYHQTIKGIEEKYAQEKSQSASVVEGLRQELLEKKETVATLTKESAYFKEKYEKTNEELINSLRNHAQEIREIKDIHQKELSKERQRRQKDLTKEKQRHKKELAKEHELKDKETEQIRQKEIVYVDKAKQRREERSIADESRIQIKQNPKIHIQSQLQFQQYNSAQQEPLEERMIDQTRSVQRQSIKNSLIKQIKNKPSDSLSQQQPKRNYMLQQKSSAKSKSKQQTNNSRKLSHDRVPSNQREQSKSRSKSREYERPTINYDNEHSFILKSCEPVTQQDNIQLYSRQPYYYHHSANNPTRNSATYYCEPNQIAQFGLSQRGNPSISSYTVEKAMLVEINKETIRLIEQQEKCIGLLNDNINPNERAENLGRMKQISDQIKLNNEKMLQLKSKIALP